MFGQRLARDVNTGRQRHLAAAAKPSPPKFCRKCVSIQFSIFKYILDEGLQFRFFRYFRNKSAVCVLSSVTIEFFAQNIVRFPYCPTLDTRYNRTIHRTVVRSCCRNCSNKAFSTVVIKLSAHSALLNN